VKTATSLLVGASWLSEAAPEISGPFGSDIAIARTPDALLPRARAFSQRCECARSHNRSAICRYRIGSGPRADQKLLGQQAAIDRLINVD
jgi:hypothetical protein